MADADELVRRLDRWLKEHRREYYEGLNPGLSEAGIAALESTLSVDLPEEFKALYRWRNGQNDGNNDSILYNYSLMSSENIADTANVMNELQAGGEFDQANWWNAGWVPFLENGGGDNYCIDMAGSFGGHKGQILQFNHDYEARDIEFGSFGKWLETLVLALEGGLLEHDDTGMQPVDYERFKAFLSQVNPGYPVDQNAG